MNKIWIVFWAGLLSGVIGLPLTAVAMLISIYASARGFGPLPALNTVNDMLAGGAGPLNLVPAIVYGLITGTCFLYLLPIGKKFLGLVSWVIASVVSWTAAILLGWNGNELFVGPFSAITNSVNFNLYNLFLSHPSIFYAASGLVGALVLSIAFHFIFKKMTLTQHVMVVMTGTLVAFLIAYFDPQNYSPSGMGPQPVDLIPFPLVPTLMIAWQTLVTTTLGIFSARKEVTKT